MFVDSCEQPVCCNGLRSITMRDMGEWRRSLADYIRLGSILARSKMDR